MARFRGRRRRHPTPFFSPGSPPHSSPGLLPRRPESQPRLAKPAPCLCSWPPWPAPWLGVRLAGPPPWSAPWLGAQPPWPRAQAAAAAGRVRSGPPLGFRYQGFDLMDASACRFLELPGLESGRLDSVSDYCIHHCLCPVVVVRYADDAAGAGGNGARLIDELHTVPEDGPVYYDAPEFLLRLDFSVMNFSVPYSKSRYFSFYAIKTECLKAIGITNQRETTVTWRYAVQTGYALFGTIDTCLIWNLLGGVAGGQHVTDCSSASRTMLMNLKTLDWDKPTLDELMY
ncbi:unnamed protein product [Miscanthus lutarioriparius]|uniref:Carbohydrate kinase FGGY N-terminal domain-containing protein n=1 Tax=Miscanthus lutarioriparius TaxID=422564 RepID=A0A811QAW9_9POAL|nr:unnamed protein product [Miscanthus lutarioriparius]